VVVPKRNGSRSRILKRLTPYLLIVLFITSLYFLSTYNYLLFHSVAELFSIVVAYGIFIISWNCRHNLEDKYLMLLGIAYLFVGSLDLLHMLAYKGMGVFPRDGANLPTQLWIAARYLEGASLLAAFSFPLKRLSVPWVLAGYGTTSLLVILSIFLWRIFPTCYVEGEGLTAFKKYSEIVISLLFMGSILKVIQRRRIFDRFVLRLVIVSLVLSIFSEIAFVFYVDVYGISNLLGHLFKIISFFCIYQALITTGLIRPFDLLFRNLKLHKDSLQKSEKQLKALNATKDRFFSLIAHDIRNPLISMDLIVRYLRDSRDVPAEEVLKLLDELEAVSKHTITLLDNLLQWSRCQTGDMKYDPAPWSLQDLLLEGIESLESHACSKNITLDVARGEDLRVLVDRNMFASIVRNLVSNAIKFSDPENPVMIDAARNGNMAEVCVRDRGRGVSPEDMDKLFRLDVHFSTPGTTKERGTGLGLILCRDFVRRHGGEIWLESEVARGTVAHFTVPAV
jgi:signal transduction histidine kinase